MWCQAGRLPRLVSLPGATGKEDQTQVGAAQLQELKIYDVQLGHPWGWKPHSPLLHIRCPPQLR